MSESLLLVSLLLVRHETQGTPCLLARIVQSSVLIIWGICSLRRIIGVPMEMLRLGWGPDMSVKLWDWKLGIAVALHVLFGLDRFIGTKSFGR